MSSVVVDSSVLLALSNYEPYQDATLAVLEGAVISSVNYAEVWTKLYGSGLTADPNVRRILSLLDRVAPLTVEHALAAAKLRLRTRHAGLSLADRACLALAVELGAEVYTADRAWGRVDVGCRVHLIR